MKISANSIKVKRLFDFEYNEECTMNENETNDISKESLPDDIDLLSQLFSYARGVRSPNELAQEVIARFKSIENFFNAVALNRRDVEWIDENVLSFISRITLFCNYYNKKKSLDNSIYDNAEAIFNYAKQLYSCIVSETLYVICLNDNFHIIESSILSVGNVSSANCDMRKLILIVSRCEAKGVVFVHNHPSGNPGPSESDLIFTTDARKVLDAIGVILYDHLIISENSFVSAENIKGSYRKLLHGKSKI